MSKRKAFALRIDEKTLTAMHRWAEDDLRSLNAQGRAAQGGAAAETGKDALIPARIGA